MPQPMRTISKRPWKPLRITRSDRLKFPLLRKRHGPILRRGGRRLFRPIVGIDPLENRAVPISEVYGSLEERIVYKELLRRKEHFTFQSSMMGGRLELGGLVADFVLPERRMIIQVQGTIWHEPYPMRVRDALQASVFQNLGYDVVYIWDWQVRNEYLFDQFMDRLFGGVP